MYKHGLLKNHFRECSLNLEPLSDQTRIKARTFSARLIPGARVMQCEEIKELNLTTLDERMVRGRDDYKAKNFRGNDKAEAAVPKEATRDKGHRWKTRMSCRDVSVCLFSGW